jgi:hypothetical protein
VYEVRICGKIGVGFIEEPQFMFWNKLGVGVFQKVLALTDSLTCGESRGLGCQLFEDHLFNQHAKK